MTDATGQPATGQDADERAATGLKLHMGLAEQGKIHALEGDHTTALGYYRHAIRLSVEAGDPELFFRHYLDCVMESLELMGAHEEVLAYCDKAIELYAEKPPPNPMAVSDLANIHQKRGVVLMKTGDNDGARESFQAALELVGSENQGAVPLASNFLRWLQSGLHVDPSRVLAEQTRCKYFMVRKDTVDPKRAIKLEDGLLNSVPGVRR